jgi:3-hydroxybutyrate dehydrogenase
MDRLLDLSKNLVSRSSSPEKKSENRVAIVTGSLSGIGLGIAHSLAKKGFNIILNGLANQAEIDKVAADFKSKYPKI